MARFKPKNNAALASVFDEDTDEDDYVRNTSNYDNIFVPEVTEVTMDQIAKKFGVDVSTLKIKKD